MKTLLSLFLVLALLLLSLASCNPTGPEDTGSKLDATEEDWYYGVDFNNKSIIVRYHESAASIYTKGPDEKGSDTVLDRCYDRNRSVAATLGLKVASRTGDNSLDYMNEIALMPDAAPDLTILRNDITLTCTLEGYIRQINRAPNGKTSYFDFDAECWYLDFMEGLTMDESKYFAVAGDYFIDVLRQADCLYMNTDYYQEKIGTLKEFYSLVERGMFNADEMKNMIELAYEDITDQGYVDEGDRLGLLCQRSVSFYPWIYGTDAAVVEKSATEGWVIRDNPQDFVELIDNVIDVYTANGTYQTESNLTDRKNYFMDKFRENGVLFVSTLRMGDLEEQKMQNMDNKIAVVYPKMNRLQGYYRTYVNYDAEVGMIPVQAKQNYTEVSAYLQLLNEQSTDIVDQYFQESLKFKYSTEASGAGRMLDVIYDSIGSSFYKNISDAACGESGYTQSEVPQLVAMVSKCVGNKQNSFTEQWASYREAYRAGLEKLKGKYAALGE